jgi:hypothetical protein
MKSWPVLGPAYHPLSIPWLVIGLWFTLILVSAAVGALASGAFMGMAVLSLGLTPMVVMVLIGFGASSHDAADMFGDTDSTRAS